MDDGLLPTSPEAVAWLSFGSVTTLGFKMRKHREAQVLFDIVV